MQWGVEVGGSLSCFDIGAASQRRTTLFELSHPPPVTPILLCILESSPQTSSELTDPNPSPLDHPQCPKLSPLSFSWFLTKVETAQAQPPNRDAQLPPRGVQIDCSAEKSL